MGGEYVFTYLHTSDGWMLVCLLHLLLVLMWIISEKAHKEKLWEVDMTAFVLIFDG